MARTVRKSKAPGRRRKGGKRVQRKKANVPDMAKCSVVRTLADIRTNTMYSYDEFQLVDFQRAVNIASNYQRFRMTNIKITWKPNFDTYSPATSNQKPYIYAMVDRSGSIPDTVTLEGLKQAGARPRALDEKPFSVNWKPAVLGESRVTAGIPQAANYLISPLLSTNGNPTSPGAWTASTVSHQGLKFWIDQPGGVTETIKVEVEIQFEFYKPLFPSLSSVPAQGLMYAKIDASPDGVEGGSDGMTVPLPLSAH